ncbi:hypothetical protein ALO72_200037 [Pseudomonas syringae pv. delphinii]|nr:hypothetical protein ALO72_200037 [Pseudomonas syringae pv. delphinii]
MIGGWLDEQRFVNIEHRVALTITRQVKNRHRRLHHLPDFRLTRRNHPRCIRDQRGITQLLAGIGQLCLRGFQRTFAAAHGRLCGVIFAAAGIALGQQLLLAHERSAGLTHASLFGGHRGGGRVDIDLQILGVKTGQHLPGSDPVADIHIALNDLAVDPK